MEPPVSSPSKINQSVSVSIRRLEDSLPSLKCLSEHTSSILSSLPSTSKDGGRAHLIQTNVEGDAESEKIANSKDALDDALNFSIEPEEPPSKRKRTLPNRYGIGPIGKEKIPLKQVSFPRKSPTKNNYSNDASLKTIKKYRNNANARNVTSTSPEKIASPNLMRRVEPKRRIKSEVEKLMFSSTGGTHETQMLKTVLPVPEIKEEQDEEYQVREWLASNEGDDVRPVRAAAIAAAKKGQLGVIKTKPKATLTLRVRPPLSRKDRVPKGKSRRTIIMKKAYCPKPIRDQPTDGAITFYKSLLCEDTYFQKGDIVSMYDSKGMGPYYLQIHYLITDEYFRECAGMRWLVPLTPHAVKQPFEPKNFKLCSSEERDVTRYLKDVNLVAHCPLEYYDETKDRNKLYRQPVNGTVYIRIDQSKDIMKFVVPDIPEIRQHNEAVKKEMEQNEGDQSKKEEPIFKCPDSTLIPWMHNSCSQPNGEISKEKKDAVDKQPEVPDDNPGSRSSTDDGGKVPKTMVKSFIHAKEEPNGEVEINQLKSGINLRPLKDIPAKANRESIQPFAEKSAKFQLVDDTSLRFSGATGVSLKN